MSSQSIPISKINCDSRATCFLPGQRTLTKDPVLATKQISICYIGAKKVRESFKFFCMSTNEHRRSQCYTAGQPAVDWHHNNLILFLLDQDKCCLLCHSSKSERLFGNQKCELKSFKSTTSDYVAQTSFPPYVIFHSCCLYFLQRPLLPLMT